MGRKAVQIIDGKLTCSKCKETKPVEDFSPNEWRVCGYASQCKACNAVTSKRTYQQNPAAVVKRSSEWAQKNPERKKALQAKRYPKTKAELLEDSRKRKHVWDARKAINNAIRDGRLKRSPCEICGAVKSEAHHHMGYEKENWLNVRWLCRKHHELEHKKY